MNAVPPTHPTPDNEAARLELLASLSILDSPPDAEIDTIVEIAADAMDAPMCLVSLLDADRQWFKARKGINISQAPRSAAFCNYPLVDGKPLVVNDTSADSRFQHNPLGERNPYIRFYAGVPLTIDSEFNIGTLCILDTRPRSFSPEQLRKLEYLARTITTIIECKSQLICAESLVRSQAKSLRRISVLKERMREQTDLLDRAASIAKIGAWRWVEDTGEISWSKEMYKLHDVSADFVPSLENLHSFFSPAVRKKVKKAAAAGREQLSDWDMEVPITTAAGVRKWVRISGSYSKTSKGIVAIGIRQDITEQMRIKEELTRLATTDTLTGLPNRLMFGKLLEMAMESYRKDATPIALCFIDIDGFKDINDLYGHAAGDSCLKFIAKRMRKICKGRADIARLGGDEFAIVLHGKNAENVIDEIVRPLIESVRQPVNIKSHTFRVSISVGLTLRCRSGQRINAMDLQKEADLAMYAAKHAGKNTYRLYDTVFREKASSRDQASRLIYSALANNCIDFHYQPKARLCDAQIIGFEALVRCKTGDGRILGPGAFQSALEDAELSAQIGAVAIQKCLQQAAEWNAAGLPFGHVALNLSASQFRDDLFPEKLLERIRALGLHPGMVHLEITEGILLSHQAKAISLALKYFREAGISIAFDDFGTGFASLTHLLEFPVDYIKIDRSFVTKIESRKKSQAIVQAIVSLATSDHLGLDIVAEGIETPNERDFLLSGGCKFGQGYLFSRPLPAQDATDFLTAHLSFKNVWNCPPWPQSANVA